MSTLTQTLARLEREEELLQFEHFSNDDAWTLGTMLVENARKMKACPAFQITVNGYTVFRYGFPGTNLHNERWLARKRNTTETTHMSSLRAGTLLQINGENIARDWYLPEEDFAVLGGGFPLTLKGTGVIGSVCCSGLPHETDHQIVADTIAQFLHISLEQKTEV